MAGPLIHHRFEAQAAASPSALAAVCGGELLTYAQLDERADHLGRRLVAAGVRPGALVAVWGARSLDTLIGLVAVAKAGAAFLPLDPAYPAERLAFMLNDAAVTILLVPAGQAVPSRIGGATSLEATSARDSEPAEAANLAPFAAPHDLAYVIYTSGSTGRPKGVMIEHAAVVNTLDDVNARFRVGPGDRVLCLSSFAFDLSVYDVFGVLGAGGAVVLPTDDEAREPAAWTRLIARHGVTLWNSVPALMELMVAYAETSNREALAPLRLALLSGDWIPVSLPDRIRALNPASEVLSLGGATEASIWSICYPIGRVESAWSSIPYGQALRNQTMHVLDDERRPCPPGTPGELYIGGLGVARGYLNRPELTAERFLPDPFAGDNGSRLYRTGDLGRFLPDGQIEFLGRVDNQVKINGYRIELGEIEASLARHPQIRDTAVVAPRDAAGRRRLAAFFVPTNAPGPTEHELREYLAAHLPAYMLPSRFAALPALPLTSNGKVDRQALSSQKPASAESDRPITPPRTTAEARIAGIWRDVLQSDAVSMDDRFVEAGGDSLEMVNLMLRINATFGIDLPVATPLVEAPTVADLAAKVEIASRTVQRGAGRETAARRNPDECEFPASPGQRQLWAVEQVQPRNPAYNIAVHYHLHGRLDSSALAKSLHAIVARHEPLRTVFRLADDGTLRQVVRPHVDFEMPIVDLHELPRERREAVAESRLDESARQLFDLADDCPIRAILVRMAEDEHQLLLTMHHIASDGWSVGALNLELAAWYGPFCRGDVAELPPLPTQYVEYSLELEDRLRGDRRRELAEYWQRRLAGPLPLLELPADGSQPLVPTAAGATRHFRLSPELTAGLKEFAAREGATLFMALLAGFSTVLARYSGQEDIVIGSPLAGRNAPELARLIGYFVNVLALRVDLSGNPTFRELLHRVRRATADDFMHQEMPLVELASQLDFDRQAGDHVPFRTMLVLHNTPISPLEIAGLDVQMRLLDTATAKADLVLSLTESQGGLNAALEYRTELYNEDRVERFAEHFSRLLAAATDRPDLLIAELPYLTADEVRRFAEWNDTATDYPRQATISQLFERQVRESPSAPALLFGDEHWTYAELNHRADKIAQRLRSAGVTAAMPIGICLERSPELIACLLGILKSGGAYVPLDLSYPADRLQFMALDADLRLVISTREASAGSIAWDVPVMCLDADTPTGVAVRSGSARPATANDPAYILFTSGSTGQPKGVAVPHRAVLRLVKGANYLEFTARDVFLQFAPVSFDAATLEIWGPLLNGGRLALAPAGFVSVAELGRLIRRHQVTTLWLTAGLFHQVVDERLGDLAGLKHLLAGGDVLSPEHVRRALAALPQTTLINGYGPTENTTFTTCHIMRGAAALGNGAVPIGRPIANTQVYILDRQLQPVPIGVPGEIHCGGDGLAIGYVNRPDLNEQKFFDQRLPDGRTVRLYKTGDLGRWLADGTVQFLGRLDHQVKIRGFRIEPGEIEAALCRHAAVRQAAVVVTVDPLLRKQLTAYVALGDAPPVPAKDFQAFLRGRLPPYMVPTQFVCLDELPLDANGKVDRPSLPRVPRIAQGAAGDLTAPRDDVERRLAKIWEVVFDLTAADVYDDFFALGGDSLLAVSLLARVDREFNSTLQLTDLVQHPTIAALAELLGDKAAPRAASMAVEIQTGGTRPILFFAPCVAGNLMTARALAARLDVEQPVFGLQPIGADGRGVPYDSVPRLADYYLQQVRQVQPRGPYYLAGYSFGGTVAFEMAQRLAAANEVVGLLLLMDAPLRTRPLFVQFGQRVAEWIVNLAAAARRKLTRAAAVATEPPPVNAAMVAAHKRALHNYQARPYHGPTVIFRTVDRSHGLKRMIDGWTQDWKRRSLVDHETPVVWTPGDHTTMFARPHVDVLAEHVERQLEAALDPTGSSLPAR